MSLQTGTLLHAGSYRIIRFIGQGGFGCTYEVEHVSMARHMAMKEFFVSSMCNRDATGYVSAGITTQVALVDKLRQKFINEARSVNYLNHPNIVRVTDVFEENGTAYFVMDYIKGESLQSKLDHNGPLSETEAIGYINQLCDAIEYVHEQSMLHLDIKPDNVMVDGKGRAILIDFGVSKQYDEANGQNTSTVVGQSIGYSPLEQVGNKVHNFTPATDIYSIGATLYALLKGAAPIDSTDLAAGEPLAPLPSYVSKATRDAIEQAMKPRAKDRPQSISEFRQLLSGESAAETSMSQTSSLKTIPYGTPTTSSQHSKTQPIDNKQNVSITQPKERNTSETKLYKAEEDPKSQSKRWIKWISIASAVAIVAVLSFIFLGQPVTTVSGSHNGHDYVDLGLPSGTMWATCNIGSPIPAGYGRFFSWGATSPQYEFKWFNSLYLEKGFLWLKNYDYVDAEGNLLKNDAAQANWGGNWRMPTKEEIKELLAHTTLQKKKYGDVSGVRLTSRINGNYIFLPASGKGMGYGINSAQSDSIGLWGNYWSATLKGVDNLVYTLSFSLTRDEIGVYPDFIGNPIRPVITNSPKLDD